MKDDSQVAILADYQCYGFDRPTLGFIAPSLSCHPRYRLLTFGDGSWVEVAVNDLIEITLTEYQKQRIFPLYA